MKTFVGIFIIIIALTSLFRYPNLGRSLPETIGVLIGFSIFLIPAILLIKSDMKNDKN
jgi:hypothetical protein